MSCPIKVNSNTIELTLHTSYYWVLDLLSVTTDWTTHYFSPSSLQNTSLKWLTLSFCTHDVIQVGQISIACRKNIYTCILLIYFYIQYFVKHFKIYRSNLFYFIFLAYYCVYLVSTWWRESWTKNNGKVPSKTLWCQS